MTRRTRALLTLIKLQETEKNNAAKTLLTIRDVEQRALVALQQTENIMVQEREIAQIGRSELDDFRTWFPIGLNAIGQARETHEQARLGVENARVAALHAAVAHKATQDVFQRRAKERNDLMQRRESAELDELARREWGNETFTS
ncbi:MULTISPECIES: flagellar FliJ family protein [Asaia]|uniref:flagellar FliJ family protein n=1 Tax=Asaia TaxID=91914 RepID=UPI002FC29BCA